MKIYIEDLTFDCILGILDFERVNSQKVIVSVEVDYEYKKDDFINYAILAELIKKDMKNNKYFLIEDALLSLHVKIKEEFLQITTLKLKISKPTILDDCDVSVAYTKNY